ncbi:MAG: HAMP domain-containing sensor histidine kinase [Phycisphaerales bacterium]
MRFETVRTWFHELPLASKSLLLFGAASALIVTIALMLPLLRMNALVGAGQLDQSRVLAAAYRSVAGADPMDPGDDPVTFGGAEIRELTLAHATQAARDDRFLERALHRLTDPEGPADFMETKWDGGTRVSRYARAEHAPDGSVRTVLTVERRSEGAAWQVIVNVLFVIAAGSVVLAVALVVYAVIANRLILVPVESLKATAERVRDGRLDTRSEIQTGDEFEELADTFNMMLTELERGQQRLRSINAAMDVKLSELTEANVALYESAKLKGDFVASVSHELRTPLNSIIGFAELLLEIARRETAVVGEGKKFEPDEEQLRKRERYLVNIVTAGRTLLEMIESLLEMAKIEAGRVEVNPEPMVLPEVCEGLVGLIYPLAHKKGIDVEVELDPDLPVVETDVKKFQQIVFNLLSNAVKFTAREAARGEVRLRAERLPDAGAGERVRVSVIDNGPGIPREEQDRVFGKFQQLEGGHTKRHPGTGLGLAIVRELTTILQGEVQLVSEVGRGSMFSVILPVRIDPERLQEERRTRREAAEAGAIRTQPEPAAAE